MCAANTFNSICCSRGTLLGVFPSQPFQPTMNSRNGDAATATRSRGSVGKCTVGPEFAARAKAGKSHVAAAALMHCSTNCLRVVGLMRRKCSRKNSLYCGDPRGHAVEV